MGLRKDLHKKGQEHQWVLERIYTKKDGERRGYLLQGFNGKPGTKINTNITYLDP